MIDPTFRNINRLFNRNINRLFVQLFKAGENDSTRNYFVKYYMPLVEINNFNTLIINNFLINP